VNVLRLLPEHGRRRRAGSLLPLDQLSDSFQSSPYYKTASLSNVRLNTMNETACRSSTHR
jgi:hypothetical protein